MEVHVHIKYQPTTTRTKEFTCDKKVQSLVLVHSCFLGVFFVAWEIWFYIIVALRYIQHTCVSILTIKRKRKRNDSLMCFNQGTDNHQCSGVFVIIPPFCLSFACSYVHSYFLPSRSWKWGIPILPTPILPTPTFYSHFAYFQCLPFYRFIYTWFYVIYYLLLMVLR